MAQLPLSDEVPTAVRADELHRATPLLGKLLVRDSLTPSKSHRGAKQGEHSAKKVYRDRTFDD